MKIKKPKIQLTPITQRLEDAIHAINAMNTTDEIDEIIERIGCPRSFIDGRLREIDENMTSEDVTLLF